MEWWNNIENWMQNTPEFLNIPVGYFLLLLVVVILTIFIRWILVGVIVKWLEKKSESTETELDDLIVDAIKKPIGWIIIAVGLLVAYIGMSGLLRPTSEELNRDAIQYAEKIEYESEQSEINAIEEYKQEKKAEIKSLDDFMRNLFFSLILVFAAWLLWNLVNNLSKFFSKKAELTDTKLDDQLVPVARKILKILIASITGIVVIQNLGFDVTGVIAGLGIGGLAFALAAQDTLSNMFGSATLFGSKPFQIGDYIVFGDIAGIVEEIGIRTTKIRQFDRHLVIVPNNHVAKGVVTNVSSRGSMYRFRETIGVTYDSTPAQLNALVEGIRELILNNEKTMKESFYVYFINYGDFSLDILIQFFFEMPNGYPEYLDEKHNFLLDIMRLIDKLGLEFAFPSRTLYNYSSDLNSDKDANMKKFYAYMRRKREQQRLRELRELKDEDMSEKEKEEHLKKELETKEEHLNELKEQVKKNEEEIEELKDQIEPERKKEGKEKTDDEKKVEEGLAKQGQVEEDE